MKTALRLGFTAVSLFLLASCSSNQKLKISDTAPYHKVYFRDRVIYTPRDHEIQKLSLQVPDKPETYEAVEDAIPLPARTNTRKNAELPKITLLNSLFTGCLQPASNEGLDNISRQNQMSTDETHGLLGMIFGAAALLTLAIPIASSLVFMIGFGLALAGIFLSADGLEAFDNRIFGILGLTFSLAFLLILIGLFLLVIFY